MLRFLLLTAAVVVWLAALPTGLAGPACARRNADSPDCPTNCADKWGWSGRVMGTNPWGRVMNRDTGSGIKTVPRKMCRVRTSSSPSVATSSTVAPVASGPVQNVNNGPPVVFPSASSLIVAETSPSAIHEPTPTPSSESSEAHSTTTHIFAPAPTIHTVETISFTHTNTPEAPPAVTTSKAQPVEKSSPPPPPPVVHTSSPPPPPVVHTSSPPPSPPPPAQTKAPTTNKAAPPPPPPSSTPTPAQGVSSSSSNSDIDQYLTAHNTVRAQHGAVPLQWSDELAGKAQQWANGCQFKHSGGSLGPYGENLAAGTGSSYDIAAAVKSWTDEVSEYDPNNPQPSHFTQVVWKGSTQVGCAMQLCNGIFDPKFGVAKYFVCEYSPQGNIIGQFPQNVQA